MNIKEKIENGWIQAVIVIEILGRPAEYVKESIDKILETIGKEKGIEIINKKVYPVKEIEGQKDVFSTFAEIEFLAENYKRLVDIVFAYFPVSIEIIEPQELTWKREDANIFINDLASRLHQYDLIAKTITLQNNALKNKIIEMQKLVQPSEEQSKESSEKNEDSKKDKKRK